MAFLGAAGYRNRLSKEISPYLLQHASNPVDWYPWGAEALQKAKAEDKPIFLSVGYSTCHWCHVMERETFSKQEVADVMNTHFVSIKVDREERPDIDHVYMVFLQAIVQGGGGWPMNVWLTPDLHPFHAGTYYPAEQLSDQPSFSVVMSEIIRQWDQNRTVILQTGMDFITSLRKTISDRMANAVAVPSPDCVQKCFKQLRDLFDVTNGGFCKVPKFSQPASFNFLLRLYGSNPYSDAGQQALTMTLLTLRKMAEGGIHDHIGNGFHRYAADEFWHIPHFEKMLYDQAQLCVCYLEAFQITKDLYFAEVVKDILCYMVRDLRDTEGGFFSAEDAESCTELGSAQKREGAFCVWQAEEIQQLLPQVIDGTCIVGRCVSWSEVFCYHYCVKQEGNVPADLDIRGDLKTQNVLKKRCSVADTAAHFSIPADIVDQVLKQSKQVLLAARRLRPRPHRDEKIVTGWNGLAITAFARAGQVLGDEECTQKAVMAAHFIKSHMFVNGRLKRNAYRHSGGTRELGISAADAFAPDYAYLICGLMDLYEATFNDLWMEWAVQLQDAMDVLFWDPIHGGYYDIVEGDPSVLLRLKEDQDDTEPTASSVAARNLLRLAEYTQNQTYRDRAQATFASFGQRLLNNPELLPEMMSAYLFSTVNKMQLLVTGSRYVQDWQTLIDYVHSTYAPFKTIAYVPSNDVYVAKRLPMLTGLADGIGPPQVYVCAEGKCNPPTSDPIIIANLLTPSPPATTLNSLGLNFELSAAMY